MKAKTWLAAAALALACDASALFDANVFGGYTTFSMEKVNDFMEASKVNLTGMGATVDLTKFSGGYYVGADFGLSVAPFIKIGPRVEYLQASPAKMEASSSGNKEVSTIEAGLIPLMLGLSADIGFPLTDLSAKAGLWGGYGLAHGKVVEDRPGIPTKTEGLSGKGFVGEIAASLRYSVAPFLSLGLEAGFRYAPISEMISDKTATPITDSANNPLPFDYSGLLLGGALNFNF